MQTTVLLWPAQHVCRYSSHLPIRYQLVLLLPKANPSYGASALLLLNATAQHPTSTNLHHSRTIAAAISSQRFLSLLLSEAKDLCFYTQIRSLRQEYSNTAQSVKSYLGSPIATSCPSISTYVPTREKQQSSPKPMIPFANPLSFFSLPFPFLQKTQKNKSPRYSTVSEHDHGVTQGKSPDNPLFIPRISPVHANQTGPVQPKPNPSSPSRF